MKIYFFCLSSGACRGAGKSPFVKNKFEAIEKQQKLYPSHFPP